MDWLNALDPSTQKIITWIIGLLAAILTQHVPGVPPDIATLISAMLLSAVTGYVKQHFAEREQLCPECAIERAAEKASALQQAEKPKGS